GLVAARLHVAAPPERLPTRAVPLAPAGRALARLSALLLGEQRRRLGERGRIVVAAGLAFPRALPFALAALAVGALAVGALAVGALAVGALAAGPRAVLGDGVSRAGAAGLARAHAIALLFSALPLPLSLTFLAVVAARGAFEAAHRLLAGGAPRELPEIVAPLLRLGAAARVTVAARRGRVAEVALQPLEPA